MNKGGALPILPMLPGASFNFLRRNKKSAREALFL